MTPTVFKKVPLTFLFMILVGSLGFLIDGTSSLRGPDEPEQNYSVHRALEHLQAIAQKPRPQGSLANREAAQYLQEQLIGLGLEPILQQGVYSGEITRPTVPVPPTNVLARLKGSEGKQVILLSAHYDSAAIGPGAGDNGAAVATLLEVLRALKSDVPLKHDVIFAFVDGEELGLRGARLFVDEHPWAAEIDLVINLDARGSHGPVVMYETTPHDDWLLKMFQEGVPQAVSYSLAAEVYKLMPNLSDFNEYVRIPDVQGLNFAFLHGPNYYHTGADRTVSLELTTLQHQGDQVLAALRHFGNAPIEVGTGSAGTYFYTLGLGLVGYPGGMLWPVTLIMVLLLGAFLVPRFRRQELTVSGLLKGLVSSVVLLIVCIVACALLWLVFDKLVSMDVGPLRHPYRSEFYFFAFLCFGFGLILGLKEFLLSRLPVSSLIAGGLTLWVILGIVVSVALPGASFLFVLPCLFVLMGMLTIREIEEGSAMQVWLGTLACVPAMVIYLPLTALLYLCMPFAPLPMPALIAGCTVGLLALLLMGPLHIAVETGHRSFLPKLLLGLGLAIFIGLSALNMRHDAMHPRQESLIFMADLDAGEYSWLSQQQSPKTWNGQVLKGQPAFKPLSKLGPRNRTPVAHYPASAVELPRTQVEVVSQKVEGQSRNLVLRLKPPQQTIVLRVVFEQPFVKAFLGERAIHSDVGHLHMRHLPPDGNELRLTVTAGEPLRLRTVAVIPGFPDNTIDPVPEEVIPYSMRTRYLEHSTVIVETIEIPLPDVEASK